MAIVQQILTRLRTAALEIINPSTCLIHYEQAVYGSFPFRTQGYGFLAQSPGCRAEWLTGFRAACQRIGEQPALAVEHSGFFAVRLDRGVWLVVGMTPQGRDDRGRPGALAFHGLFLTSREYRQAGASPFALAPALRSNWSAETTALDSGCLMVDRGARDESLGDEQADAIARKLLSGRRVVLESPTPIDELAKQVWDRLTPRARGRLSVATWAFGNGNRFDLLAVPRLAGVALDGSYDLAAASVSTASV